MGIPRVMKWRNNGPCRCEHEVLPNATIYCFVWVCLLQSTIVLSIATNIINPSLIDTWWMNIPKKKQMNHDESSNSFWDKWCHPKVWSFPKPENVHFNKTARWNAENISASTPNLQRVLQPQSWNLECKRLWITYNHILIRQHSRFDWVEQKIAWMGNIGLDIYVHTIYIRSGLILKSTSITTHFISFYNFKINITSRPECSDHQWLVIG